MISRTLKSSISQRSFSQTKNRRESLVRGQFARLWLATIQVAKGLATIFADRARPLAAVSSRDVSGQLLPVATALGGAKEGPDVGVSGFDQRLAQQRPTAAGAPETGGRGVPRATV